MQEIRRVVMLQAMRFSGRNGLGEPVETTKQLNEFLLTIDHTDIVSVTFTVENDEWGMGHSIAHVVYKVFK